MYTRPQKLVAEFLGTFALIFFGAGSICADQLLKAFRSVTNTNSEWGASRLSLRSARNSSPCRG